MHELLTECFKTVYESLRWEEVSEAGAEMGQCWAFLNISNNSRARAARPRFGTAWVEEEAYQISQPLQNSLSVRGGRRLRTNPESLDILSAEVANVIMCSKISSVTGLGASLRFCLQEEIPSSSLSPVNHLSGTGDEKAALEKQLKLLDLLSPSSFVSLSDPWHFEARGDK